MKPKKRILNLGCGKYTYGTDFLDLYPERPEVKKFNADKDKLPYPDNTFDEVRFNGVLEHLANCGLALEEIYRVLKKNGKLSLITDNANYWGWAVGETHLGGYEKGEGYGQGKTENRHYSLFTEWHLRNHARAAGFRKTKIEYFLVQDKLSMRHILRLIVKSLVSRTPFYRMGFSEMKMEATK